MKILIILKLRDPRVVSKNSLIRSSYSFFFGGTLSGKTIKSEDRSILLLLLLLFDSVEKEDKILGGCLINDFKIIYDTSLFLYNK